MALSHKGFLKLWSDAAPGALLHDPHASLPNEHIPTLQAFLPPHDRATGAACVVCPGGGYRMLADYEGPDVAEWLAAHGVTAFVLRYRLGPTYRYPTQLLDAQRALRFVRYHAQEWQLDPNRIGILGFSAGGHLTSMAATRATPGDEMASDPIERVLSHPDVQILIYPVISFHITYKPVDALLGHDPHPPTALLDELSSERHVKHDNPPAFLVHTTNDTVVSVENSDLYAASLKAAEVPFEYIRGDFGEHGFGMQEVWTHPCIEWLRHLNFAR